MAIVISAAIMVAISVAIIAVPVAVPMMIVFSRAAIPVPISTKEAISLIARRNPAVAGIDWTRPVAFMPFIVVSYRIPIALHPNEFRAWTRRKNANHSRGRWRTNSNPDRNLAVHGSCCQKNQRKKYFLHVTLSSTKLSIALPREAQGLLVPARVGSLALPPDARYR